MVTKLLIISTVLAGMFLFVHQPVYGFFHKSEVGGDVGAEWERTKDKLDDEYDRGRKNIDDEFDRAVDRIGDVTRATIKDIKKLRNATLDDLKRLRDTSINDMKSLRETTLKDIKKARDDARDFLLTMVLVVGVISLVIAGFFVFIFAAHVRRQLAAKPPA